MNNQLIKLNSIKNGKLYEIAEMYLNIVKAFRIINFHYPEYLALKYLVLFEPGKKIDI